MTTMETRIAINKAIGVDARQSHLSTPVPMIWLHDSDLRTTIHSSASPPPHQSPKRRRSLVRKLGFADNVVECGDAARLGMTEDEIASVWYTSKELSDMAKEDRRMLLVARQFGLHTKVNEFCVRGLESHLSRRSRIEQRVRKAAVLQAVLTEQHNQRLRNVYEPSRLRRKSLAASKPSRKHALYLATQDSLEVLSFRSLDVRGSKTMADPPSAIRRSRSAYDVRPSHEDAMEKIIIDHDTRTIFL